MTNICSDKTGTLTEGKMVAKSAWIAGKNYNITGTTIEPTGDLIPEGADEKDKVVVTDEVAKNFLGEAIHAAALCGTSSLYQDSETKAWKTSGTPTEVALQVLAAKLKLSKPYVPPV